MITRLFALFPGNKVRRREALIGLAFLSPWLLGFIVLKCVPILFSFIYSLTNFHMLEPNNIHFIGLANYLVFFSDSEAMVSMAGSIGYYLFTVPVQMIFALFMAVVFTSERLKGKWFLRPLFFMPSIIPVVAIFSIWTGMIDLKTGWLNILLQKFFGLPPSYGIGALFSLTALMSFWSIGPGFLIMLGAIQSIPKEINDAARVDGAGPITRLFFITLPMISPAIFFSLVINLTSAFGGTVILDRGFVFHESLSPMENYITLQMFTALNLGYACALAWIMFSITISITVWVFRSARTWVYFPE
jgi:multiple sugar transport system permease protein